jgi:hypothetical protein
MMDEHCKILASAIRQNSSIRQLCLHNNFISDSGLKALGKALRNTPSVKFLNLRGNRFSSAGILGFVNQVRMDSADNRPYGNASTTVKITVCSASPSFLQPSACS